MNNKTLLKISLIISIIGTFILLILANTLPIKQYKIKDINDNLIDKKIQIQGQITNIKNYDALKIITIKDKTASINTIYYTNNKLNLTKNQTITVIGTVREYKQELEIQADKIASS